MTALSTLDAESISRILDKLTNAVDSLANFSVNQQTLNAAVSTKLDCISQLVDKVRSLESRVLSLELENRRLSKDIEKLQSTESKSKPSRDYDIKSNHCQLLNENHILETDTKKCISVNRPSLIISGIPDTVEDSPIKIAERVFKLLRTPESTKSIVSARLISEKRRSDNNMRSREAIKTISINNTQTSHALVLELKSTSALDLIISKKRIKRELLTREVFKDGPDTVLYVNEFLPTEKYALLCQTRLVAKRSQYKFVWVNRGQILVRASEEFPVIRINSQNDLAMLRAGQPIASTSSC